MREAFAVQKLLIFFQQKKWQISDIMVRNFNETLTNDIVSFEQPDPGLFLVYLEYNKFKSNLLLDFYPELSIRRRI